MRASLQRSQPLGKDINPIQALPILLSFCLLAVNFEPATSWKDTDMEPRFETMAMPDQFPVFEVILKKRRRSWTWCLCTTEGQVVMQGSERRRPAAKYKADSALFLMLLGAPYRGSERQFIAGDKIR
jgi:hypothetical protein